MNLNPPNPTNATTVLGLERAKYLGQPYDLPKTSEGPAEKSTQGREEVAGGVCREPRRPRLQRGESGGLCSTRDGDACAVTAVCGATTPSACHLEEWEAAWSRGSFGRELCQPRPPAVSFLQASAQPSGAQSFAGRRAGYRAPRRATKGALKLGRSERLPTLL